MKKKILFIIPTLEAGGAEKVLINLLNLLNKDKYEVHLLLSRKKGPLLKDLPLGVKVSHLFPNKLIDRISTYLYIFLGQSFLMKLFGKKITGDYDAGISFLDSVYTDFLFFNNANIKKRVAVIHSSYISYSNKGNYRKGNHLQRIKSRYSKLNTIITVSKESLIEFKKLFGEYEDMRVIYNPINHSLIKRNSEIIDDVKLKKNTINIIAVGRLIPVKGYDKLIKACRLLVTRGLNFNLTILGDGAQKEELNALIKKLDIDDTVKIRGFVSNPYGWISKADIFVMTSIAEGLPTSLCEALILGKPVLTTNAPGCREIIDYGKSGLMVEAQETNIADGLEKFIRDKNTRDIYSEKSLTRAKIFDDEIAINEYCKVFG